MHTWIHVQLDQKNLERTLGGQSTLGHVKKDIVCKMSTQGGRGLNWEKLGPRSF